MNRLAHLALIASLAVPCALSAQQPAAAGPARAPARFASMRLVPHTPCADSAHTIAFDDDEEHDSLWNGILIGAAIGALVSVGLHDLGGSLSDRPSEPMRLREAAYGAFIGAVLGFAIDAVRTGDAGIAPDGVRE